MKCFFTIDPLRGNKVLIPGCYGSLYQDDLSCCTCSTDIPLTFAGFERQSYNEKVKELNKEISDLLFMVETMKKDNYQLMRIIEKLSKKKV